MNSLKLFDIEVVNFNRTQFATHIINELKAGKRGIVSYSLNGESLSRYHRDRDFKALMDSADYIDADGMSIVFASKLISGTRLPERIATTDWFHDFTKLSLDSSITHYFLGAKEEILETAIRNIKILYPSIQIVGWHHGYFKDAENILKDINSKNPDIIWVGLGSPKQESLARLLRNETNVGIIKTCGGLFDFLSGKNSRAPKLMQKLGFEWLYRLFLEPKRLIKRYMVTNTHFFILLIKYATIRFFKRNE
jgi:exopolysaccharide biosynthesis WecB/TagA/CpsF family protein